MRVYSIRSHHDYKQEGHMCSIPLKILFDPYYMPNILYLKDVENTFRITVDTSKDHAMIVNMGNNSIKKIQGVL